MSQINQMDLSARKRLLNINLPWRRSKRRVDKVKYNFYCHTFHFFSQKIRQHMCIGVLNILTTNSADQ